MKKIIILLLTFNFLYSFEYEIPTDKYLKELSKKVEISLKREKIESKVIYKHNPYLQTLSIMSQRQKHYKKRNKLTKSKKRNKFYLIATSKNKAFIDNKWYKINDKIGKFTLSKIYKNKVVLKYKKYIKIVSLKQRTKR